MCAQILTGVEVTEFFVIFFILGARIESRRGTHEAPLEAVPSLAAPSSRGPRVLFPGGLKIAASLRGKRPPSHPNIGVTRTSASTTEETQAEADAHQKVVTI
jgi:hypothetical protein